MARTKSEIYDQIVSEAVNQPSLNGLVTSLDTQETLLEQLTSNPSAVADWKVWMYVVSLAIALQDKYNDLFRTEVDDVASAAPAGNFEWYANRILEFQYGDELTFIGNKLQYANVDTTKQIIKHVAVVEQVDGSLIIKAAKDVSGVITPLTNAEADSLRAYIRRIKIAGTRIITLSQNSDIAHLTGVVYYNPLDIADTVKADTEAAINAYFKNLPFNGIVVKSDIVDAVKGLQSVVDFELNVLAIDAGSTMYTVGRLFQTISGYVMATGLDTSLTYTAADV